jgi:hypothetical protein
VLRAKVSPGIKRKHTELQRHGSNFVNTTLIAQQVRERINKWDCMKLKLCTAKQAVTRLKTQLSQWAKIFAGYTADKRLITRIERELQNLHPALCTG